MVCMGLVMKKVKVRQISYIMDWLMYHNGDRNFTFDPASHTTLIKEVFK